jgi:hypothetical protein
MKIKSRDRGATIRQIKKLAAALPTILTTDKRKVVIKGERMIEEGVIEHDGEVVHPDSIYMGEENVPLNHEREMLKLYRKYGEPGVAAYIKNVDNHIKALEDGKQEETQKGDKATEQ